MCQDPRRAWEADVIGESFNEGWGFRAKANPFLSWEFMSNPPAYAPVTLPHDAMLHAGRDGTDPALAPLGFFRQGEYEYAKTFVPPEAWRNRHVAVRFEGIYRGAMVHLNGEFLGQRPYGYSEFA